MNFKRGHNSKTFELIYEPRFIGARAQFIFVVQIVLLGRVETQTG
jgi:hypothetical protein